MVFILFSQVILQEAKGGRHCEEKSHSISYDFCAVRISGLEHNRSKIYHGILCLHSVGHLLLIVFKIQCRFHKSAEQRMRLVRS